MSDDIFKRARETAERYGIIRLEGPVLTPEQMDILRREFHDACDRLEKDAVDVEDRRRK